MFKPFWRERLTFSCAAGAWRGGPADQADDVFFAEISFNGPGIVADQVWFRRLGDNLEISVAGATDSLTVSNWYLGDEFHVEEFRTSSGQVLLDRQVQSLVDAMAGFTPASASTSTGAPSYFQTVLAPLIATTWH